MPPCSTEPYAVLSFYEAMRYADLDRISMREFLAHHHLSERGPIERAALDQALERSKAVLNAWRGEFWGTKGTLTLAEMLKQAPRFVRWKRPRAPYTWA